jgi:hypothetical protein
MNSLNEMINRILERDGHNLSPESYSELHWLKVHLQIALMFETKGNNPYAIEPKLLLQ